MQKVRPKKNKEDDSCPFVWFVCQGEITVREGMNEGNGIAVALSIRPNLLATDIRRECEREREERGRARKERLRMNMTTPPSSVSEQSSAYSKKWWVTVRLCGRIGILNFSSCKMPWQHLPCPRNKIVATT